MVDAMHSGPDCDPLQMFVDRMTDLIETLGDDEPLLLDQGEQALRALIADDRWLPAACAQPHPLHYQQYLLYRDPLERFSVVSFVWGPGQSTPVHDHTVWGLIGMLRGAEIEQPWSEQDGCWVAGGERLLRPGDIGRVSPRIGDVHRVANAHADQVSISIHVYGADIGQVRRHVIDPQTGGRKDFVSGYGNASAAGG